MTDEQLLAVLKIPTQEGQIKRLIELGYTDLFVQRQCGRDGTIYEVHEGSLADVAFRLRDKIGWIEFLRAMQLVWGHWCRSSWQQRKKAGETKKHIRFIRFWTKIAKPTHYIIAALMAKEHAKE